jgi:AraC-like DNA-binding protein
MRELETRIDTLIASRRLWRMRFSDAPAPAPSVPNPSPAQAFLARARDVIAEHLADEEFGVEELAAALGQSRASLYRRFDEAGERSPMDLIWHLRLDEAARRLTTTDGTVSEVAYSVGFKSVSHFCKRFQAAYGCTPLAYVSL